MVPPVNKKEPSWLVVGLPVELVSIELAAPFVNVPPLIVKELNARVVLPVLLKVPEVRSIFVTVVV